MRATGGRLVLALLLLTAGTLTLLDAQPATSHALDAVRRAVDAVLGPAQRAAAAGVRAADDAVGPPERERELVRENARLTGELRRSQELQRRVDELDALLGLPAVADYPVVPARVTVLGAAFGFASTVTIDAGSDDGVREGLTVLNGDGLVGRTVRVGPVSSTVLLVVDPGFTAGARLARSGTVGLATGDGEGGLSYALVQGGRPAVDDTVLTTGSDTFVPGVPVGRVTALPADGTSLVATAELAPFADVGALDLVGVVTAPPRSTPRAPLQPSPR